MKLQDIEFELQRRPLQKGEVLSVVINSDDINHKVIEGVRQQFRQQIEKMNNGFYTPVFAFGVKEEEDVYLQAVKVEDGDVLSVSLQSNDEIPQEKLDQLKERFKTVLAAMGTKAEVVASQVPAGTEMDVEVQEDEQERLYGVFAMCSQEPLTVMNDTHKIHVWEEKYRLPNPCSEIRLFPDIDTEMSTEAVTKKWADLLVRSIADVEKEIHLAFNRNLPYTRRVTIGDEKFHFPMSYGHLVFSPQLKAKYDELFPTRIESADDVYVRGDSVHYDAIRASGEVIKHPAERRVTLTKSYQQPDVDGEVVRYAASVVDTVDSREAARSTPILNAAEVKAYRKHEGLCLECGDRGTFVGTACVCTNGHGKIFG